MISLRTGLFTAAALVLGSGLTIAATQGSSQAATAVPAGPYPVIGGATLHSTSVDLPSGAWVTTPLAIYLPRAGTYELDANVRGRLSGSYQLNSYIVARLWDDNTAAPLPYSQRLVYQIIDNDTNSGPVGGNNTAPISEWVTVHGPTTIHLQAMDANTAGTASIAQIYSDGEGYTTLRWVRVS